MKRTLSALTVLLACTAHAQDIGPAGSGILWRVALTLTPGSTLTLDVPDDQCRIGTVEGYDLHGRREPAKDMKLCAGSIDGLSTLTGFVMPSHVQRTPIVGGIRSDTGSHESFSLGINGSKAVLRSGNYKVVVTKLKGK